MIRKEGPFGNGERVARIAVIESRARVVDTAADTKILPALEALWGTKITEEQEVQTRMNEAAAKRAAEDAMARQVSPEELVAQLAAARRQDEATDYDQGDTPAPLVPEQRSEPTQSVAPAVFEAPLNGYVDLPIQSLEPFPDIQTLGSEQPRSQEAYLNYIAS